MARKPVPPPWSIVLTCLCFACCSRTGTKSQQLGPRPGGTLRIINQSVPETLDPQHIVFLPDWEVAALVYEGLVGPGGKPGAVRPLLAEKWNEYDGGRRWVFQLRDAFFQDDPCFADGRGRKVSAKDVLYNLQRISHPKADTPNWYLFGGKIEGLDDYREGRASTIAGVTVLDDRRVEIRLTKPYATFLEILASQAAFLVPREAVEFYGRDFGKHPVGTGPFRLVRWKPLEQILLVRNNRYWRRDAAGVRLPYLDSIDMRIRADATESHILGAFLDGESHLFVAQQKLYDTLSQDAQRSRDFRTVGVLPQSSLRFLGFSLDTGSPLARHTELRRAVAMAFDRRRLGGQSPQVRVSLADTLVPPMFLDRTPAWHANDPEAARSIFAAYRSELAGAPPVLGTNFQSDDVALLREDLGRLSVRTRVQIRPADYYGYIVRERPAIFRVSFTPSFFGPEDYYCLFYSKSSREVNLTGYRNLEYDRILEAAMIERTPRQRTALLERLEEILRRDVPAIYLSRGTPMYVISAPLVRGVQLRFVLVDYSETWLAERSDEGP